MQCYIQDADSDTPLPPSYSDLLGLYVCVCLRNIITCHCHPPLKSRCWDLMGPSCFFNHSHLLSLLSGPMPCL
jgi:hypothetical protein